MGSVQFQILPCSSLYIISASIGPFQSLVIANYRVLIGFTCDFQSSSLFLVYFAFLCLQVSPVSNFCPDTRRRRCHLFRLTCSVLLWGGWNTAKYIIGMCGEYLQCMDHTGFAPAHGTCAFLVYNAQAPACSAEELSKAGTCFPALPRSKLLEFKFSGTPQLHRFVWVYILCPSQVQGAQVTRCLVSTLSKVGCVS